MFIGKLKVKDRRYFAIGGFRIPYEVHTEVWEGYKRYYVRLFFFEFCYRKEKYVPQKKRPEDMYRYYADSPITSFLAEGKITYELKRIHCEQRAYKQLGYFPDLDDPKTLNEKIIWLALNYRNPDIAVAADKAKAKEWAGSRVGYDHVVPMIGAYENAMDIDFESLPKRFVAKLNGGWGAEKVMIVKDKSKLDTDRIRAIFSSWLYPWNIYYYRNMCVTDEKLEKPLIVIEEFIGDEEKGLDDYKFYCSRGEIKFALIVSGRGGDGESRVFVDENGEILPFARKGKGSSDSVELPLEFEKMKEISRKLSSSFPFVRVDLYDVDGHIYVGEMTFTPGMFLRFEPGEWDLKLGEMVDISEEIASLGDGKKE
ncbi:MAG: hypothetical protein K5911_04465 [Eubacteriales bacterium]|nr:hypothetical protein [Eubacteriales bacterium]